MSRIVAERWSPCPEGELDRLEATLSTAGIRQTLITIVVAVATTLAVAAAGYSVANVVWPPPPVISTPSDCVPCAPMEPVK